MQQERNIFTTTDLAVLWNIRNQNTLDKTASRYNKKGILHRLSKGIYSKKKLNDLHPYEIGCAMSGSGAYVSTESVLQEHGIIMQQVTHVTLLGKEKKEFEVNETKYICRYLNSRFLINKTGIEHNKLYSIATLERAVADILHINPNYYMDNKYALDMEKINKLRSQVYG